jgi:hypothetical protein
LYGNTFLVVHLRGDADVVGVCVAQGEALKMVPITDLVAVRLTVGEALDVGPEVPVADGDGVAV